MVIKEQKQNSPSFNTKPFEDIVSNELFQFKKFIVSENVNKRIEHKHHLHKGLFASLILMLLCTILSFGWYKSYDASKQLKANDINIGR